MENYSWYCHAGDKEGKNGYNWSYTEPCQPTESMTTCASVWKFCTQSDEDSCQGKSQLGSVDCDVWLRTEGSELVKSSIFEDVKENAAN